MGPNSSVFDDFWTGPGHDLENSPRISVVSILSKLHFFSGRATIRLCILSALRLHSMLACCAPSSVTSARGGRTTFKIIRMSAPSSLQLRGPTGKDANSAAPRFSTSAAQASVAAADLVAAAPAVAFAVAAVCCCCLLLLLLLLLLPLSLLRLQTTCYINYFCRAAAPSGLHT